MEWINYVLIAYIVNLTIVLVNLAIYFRNVSLDKKAERAPAKKLAKSIA